MNFAQRITNLLATYRFLPGPVAQVIKELAMEVDALGARLAALEKEKTT